MHDLQSRGAKDRSMNPKRTRNLNSNPAAKHERQLVWCPCPAMPQSYVSDMPLQAGRHTGKTLDREKGNITTELIQAFPAPPEKGEKGRQAVPMSSLVLGGCRDQADLTVASSTQGGSRNQGSLSAAAMPEVLQIQQDLPSLCSGLGAAGVKQTSLPRSLRSCASLVCCHHILAEPIASSVMELGTVVILKGMENEV